MFVLAIPLIVLALSVWYLQSSFRQFQIGVNKLPGPPTFPIVGNGHLIGKNPHEILTNLFKWWRQYGYSKYRVWVGSNANVIVSDPKDMENILSSTQILMKSDIYHLLHPWLGQGLLTSFGSRWRSHRKIITPSFHFNILVDFLETMNKNSTKFIEKLRDASKEEKIFDVQTLIRYCTLDVICDTAMGVHINAMDIHDSDVVKAFQYMCYSIQMRSFNPIKRNEFLFKFTPDYKHFKNALRILKDFTYDVISKRRDALLNDSKPTNIDADDEINIRPRQAFLDTLLTAKIDGQPLTLQDIYEEVSTFMFAGHDTTASGITFAIYLLSRHADVQQKVLEEQRRIFIDEPGRQCTYSDIQDMKYLDMVLKESQRLYPSVPMIARFTQTPYDLNGTTIPKGVTLNLFIFAMGYNEKYFPDPYKFDPERFNPQTRVKANPFEYVPFSAGPRNCIGQKFAQMELKAVVSKVVRVFEILPPEDGLYNLDGYMPKEAKNKYDPILSSVLTLKSDNGIHIRLRERKI